MGVPPAIYGYILTARSQKIKRKSGEKTPPKEIFAEHGPAVGIFVRSLKKAKKLPHPVKR